MRLCNWVGEGEERHRSLERKSEGCEVSGGSRSSGVPSVGEQWELQARKQKREKEARFMPLAEFSRDEN